MPTKQQSNAKRRSAGTSKPNLGQEEAELEKTGKEQMSHMEGGKARKPSAAGHQTWHQVTLAWDPSNRSQQRVAQ